MFLQEEKTLKQEMDKMGIQVIIMPISKLDWVPSDSQGTHS